MSARWYIVNIQSNTEKRVKAAIEERVAQKGMEDQVLEVLVPTEKVVGVKNNKKVESERKFFPGYILIKAHLNDDVWHLIKEIPKVSGFLGARNKPSPITQKEVDRILQRMSTFVDAEVDDLANYSIGNEVKITDGPFTSFTGNIEEIDEEKIKIKVNISIFGRVTPVVLNPNQLEII